MNRNSSLLILSLCALFNTCPVMAQSADTLDKPLAPVHEALEDTGFSIQAGVTQDFAANLAGGLRESTTSLGVLELAGEVDTCKAGWWNNGLFFIYGEYNWGSNPSLILTGDNQGVDDIAFTGGVRLGEAWYAHSFDKERYTLIFGLQDVNNEFQVISSSEYLLNNSFAITPDLSQLTLDEAPVTTLSTWPITALGITARAKVTDTAYIQTAVYDGVPGDPPHQQGLHVRFDSGDGVFWISEMGVNYVDETRKEPSYKLAHGAWFHTADFTDVDGNKDNRNGGYYLYGERNLWCNEICDSGISGFFQFGYADNHKNQIGWYVGSGLSYQGLFETLPQDNLSFGIGSAVNSTDYIDHTENAQRAETVFELTYAFRALSWFVIQPDFQYIANPGTDTNIDDAFLAMLRLNASL